MNKPWRAVGGILGLASAVAWLWTAAHLAREWEVNPQYHYAWGVLPLALWAGLRRRATTCAVGAEASGEISPGHAGRLLGAALAGAGAVAFLLGETLRWHDPGWRLTGAMLFAGATALTAGGLLSRGGWPALRAQLFPLGFAFTALPWPVSLELSLTQSLLHHVTSAAVGILNLVGTAALQRGNAIEVRTGLVGIEAACSGVESLQASLMVSLFFGEALMLSHPRRFVLVGSGVLLALGANFARVLAVTLCTAQAGPAGVARWHDPIGATATLLTFGLLAVIAWRLAAVRSPGPAAVRAPAPVVVAPSSSFFSLPSSLSPARRRRQRPPLATTAAAVLVLLTPGFARCWFTLGPGAPSTLADNDDGVPRWRPDVSRLPTGWQAIPVLPTKTETAMLRYAEREGWTISAPNGKTARVVWFWWNPRDALPAAAFSHSPALCLPSVGWDPVGDPASVNLQVHGELWPAVAGRFEQENFHLDALQLLAAGGKPDWSTVVTTPSRGATGSRLNLAQLWQPPRRRINEELLLYLPQTAGFQRSRTEAEALLSVLCQVPSAR